MRRKESPGVLGENAGARRARRAETKVRAHPSEPLTNEQGRTVYLLRLQSQRGGNDVGRLRAVLKILLRSYGMRCLSIEPEAQS